MMNGMMFGGEGPVMQGTWYNPKTGDAFTVRDSFFEDNQYVVTTTDGRYLNYNQIQNYIQSDMPLEQLKKQMKPQQPAKNEIPAELKDLIETEDSVESMMSPEDAALITGGRSLGNLNDRHIAPASEHQIKLPVTQDVPSNINYSIIEKALKNASKPEIDVNIKWDNYPLKQIDMLTDVMEIPIDEIVTWYLDNINMYDIAEAVKESIKCRLLCEDGGKSELDLRHLIGVQEEAEEVIASYSTYATTIDKKAVKSPKTVKTKSKKA